MRHPTRFQNVNPRDLTPVNDATTLLADTETISYDLDGGGVDFTRVLDRSQDTYLRNSGFQLKDGSSVENEVAYRYDSTGRYGEIEVPAGIFYGYTPNSYLIGSVTGPVQVVTNTWEENRDVLDIKENKVGSTAISKYDYAVNGIGQRTGVATSGTAFVSAGSIGWGYDSLGQVTSADSSESGGDRSFEYDSIGNRKNQPIVLRFRPAITTRVTPSTNTRRWDHFLQITTKTAMQLRIRYQFLLALIAH